MNWTGPVIRYACMAGVAITAGFAFGPVFAFGGMVAITVLSFWG